MKEEKLELKPWTDTTLVISKLQHKVFVSKIVLGSVTSFSFNQNVCKQLKDLG